MARYVYCFLHVPKTGGSTVNRVLRNNLEFDEEFIHFGTMGHRYRAEAGRTSWPTRPSERRSRARILGGHALRYGTHESVPDATPRYFTILREPASRILSAYNFHMQKYDLDVPFWDWFDTYPRNVQYRKIKRAYHIDDRDAVDRTRDALRSMWFVGVTAHLDEDLPHIFRHLGVPQTWKNMRASTDDRRLAEESQALPPGERWRVGNVVYRRLELTADLRDRLYELNPRDVKMFNLASRLRLKKLAKLHSRN